MFKMYFFSFRLVDDWLFDGSVNDTVYEILEKYVSVEWYYNDIESDIVKAWCVVGIYFYVEDILLKKEFNIFLMNSNGVNVVLVLVMKLGLFFYLLFFYFILFLNLLKCIMY